jgi:hypothetical protein
VPGASFERSIQPTAALPMKLRNAVRGSLARDWATSWSMVDTTWHQASGRPAWRKILTSS